jgi:hypothetical protein
MTLQQWAPFNADGTHQISGTELTIKPLVNKVAGGMSPDGRFLTTYTFTFEGNTLTLTTKANENGPAAPAALKLTRLE